MPHMTFRSTFRSYGFVADVTFKWEYFIPD